MTEGVPSQKDLRVVQRQDGGGDWPKSLNFLFTPKTVFPKSFKFSGIHGLVARATIAGVRVSDLHSNHGSPLPPSGLFFQWQLV